MKFSEYNKAQKKYGVNRGGSDWMQLQEGDNIVRIVSEFEDFGSHYSTQNQQSYVCIGKEECPFCQEDDEPRAQFLGWIIDRDDDQFKLLRIGYSIFGSIGDFAETEGYEFDVIPDYDFIIKRSGTGLETEYGVIPRKKSKSLTETQETTIEDLTPPEEIIESMKENTRQLTLNSGGTKTQESESKAEKPEWWPLYEEEEGKNERPENPLESAEGARIEFLQDKLKNMDLNPNEVVFELNNRSHGEERELTISDLTEGDAWDLCQAMIQKDEKELRKYIQ